MPKLKATSTTEWAGLLGLLGLYLALALAHSSLAPLTTGPDELAHYEYLNFIAENGRLPATTVERGEASYKSDQPPLYHLLAAVPASLVDIQGPPYLKRYADHPRRQLIERTRHAWGLYNTEDEQWPYRGEVLRWHVGRWVAIFFGLLTVAATFFTARLVFGNRHWPALAAAAIVAFIPRFILTGSTLNYETLQTFIMTLFLWLLLRMAAGSGKQIAGSGEQVAGSSKQVADSRQQVAGGGEQVAGSREPVAESMQQEAVSRKQPQARTPNPKPRTSAIRNSQLALLLGLLAGLAITTKLSALIVPLEIFIAFWLIGRFYGVSWRVWGRWLGAAALTTLLGVSWWFGFVVYQFNTAAQDGWWTGLLRPLIAADASDATTNRLLSFLTGGQAGFTAAIDNLDSGPPWEWASVFFRTFWSVGIEQQQPLGWVGLFIALVFCLIAAVGLAGTRWPVAGGRWQVADSKWPVAGSRQQGAGTQTKGQEARSRNAKRRAESRQHKTKTQHATRNTQNPSLITHHASLITSLLLLHLLLPALLPLIRYAVTFSLADTAQGRHVLFMAAPAFAILLVGGLTEATRWLAGRLPGRIATDGLVVRSSALAPALFLLLWSLVQLWTMSWAYIPLLPVTTQPQRLGDNRITNRLDQPLNEQVTLLGYDRWLAPDNRQMQLTLWWQAEAVSPVDYLTRVELLDENGISQAEWLGYTAQGRYPTRAWDPGDIVRDQLWLPIAGLPAGAYSLHLSLQPATVGQPNSITSSQPLTLEPFVLANPPPPNFEMTLPQEESPVAYTIWQQDRPVSSPQSFHYRQTIPVTLNAGRAVAVQMVTPGPDGQPLRFNPVLQTDRQALFIVGPDWPSGDYRLQSEIAQAEPFAGKALVRVINRWERQFAEPPLSRRVEANFAGKLKLLGYDLVNNRAEPGGAVPLTLYWQGLDWLGEDYTIFTRLMAADQSVHGGRDRLPREGYRTLYWAPGEIVTDPLGVAVAPDAPNGVYTINLGLYREVDGQAVSLPLVDPATGQPTGMTSLNIGPVKIGVTPPDFVLDSASPDNPINISLGDQIELLGFDLTASESANLRIGESTAQLTSQPNATNALTLQLYWQALRQPPLDYTTFVHLRDAAGETVAQKDQPPLAGAYPTSLWDPGETIADTVVIPLPDTLPAGEYSLVVGLYDFNTFQRLPVPGNPANEVTLASVKTGK